LKLLPIAYCLLPLAYCLPPPVNLDAFELISDCLSKRFAIREIFQREAKGNKQRISEDEIPKLWILTPTASERILSLDELERLLPNDPLKSASLNLLYNLSRNLAALSKKTQEDREFIMRLAPLYQQDREQAIQQGVQQGEQRGEAKLLLRLIQRRFGEIPQNLEETIRNLPVEQLEDLGVALLDFDTSEDLDNWLNP
jgi:predicted transcriptional regulator